MNLSESLHEFIFGLIELGILPGSLGVVLSANAVRSAFLLGLVSACISLFYLALNADFVAAAQLLTYVGAINVLIVFAVMLTDRVVGSKSSTLSGIEKYSVPLIACTSLLILLIIMIEDPKWSNIYSPVDQSKNGLEIVLKSDIQLIGYQLLTKFLVPFELLSMILPIALVGAITMAR
uniref:NADH-plastoquinone oxidoreductase subunit 6 n=1 Tax=Anemia phyllitidis TaxID=12940 RepID=UPI0021AD2BD1|nr:NADH-plastoquinone oxidoreductase subunit 6 [Anemia phyllitidis]UUL71127.1 NADH-plastoquinone oxidoreductase subunit 6 [Anemia phyllitidis]